MAERVAQAALDRALERENLLLDYQPICLLKDRTVVAAEALMRQRRENGEVREASIITETAEKDPGSALFVIESWTMEQAFHDAVSWHEADSRPIRLNVNLSPREFEDGGIVRRLQQSLENTGFPPSQLNLEITETSYMEDPKAAVSVLNEIRALGASLWLDDFGSGHSTLSHLQYLPVDGLKLPGSLIAPLVRDRRCRSIARALISLAHDLGMEVIAEGVEEEEQLAILREAGCDMIQGFLFYRPMPAADLQKLLVR